MSNLTKEEYGAAALDVAYLAACAVKGNMPDRTRVEHMDLQRLYTAAKRHRLTAITAMTLESAGIKDPDFTREKGRVILQTALLDRERTALCQQWEAAGIWYLPLKGIVLKDYYPRYGMREMCDNDILFDAAYADKMRDIMLASGFSAESFGMHHHDVYIKESVGTFEMHRALFNPSTCENRICDYYRDIGRHLRQDSDGGFARHLSSEDFYLFMVAHTYKHFSHFGTGLRSLLDLYVYLNAFGDRLNMNEISAEAQTIGIADFEVRARTLALRLFGGEILTQKEQELLDNFIFSGAYGTIAHDVENQVKQHGKWHYLQTRLLPAYRYMARRYPVLKKLPFLLPLFWIIRIIDALIHDGKLSRKQFRAIWK